MNTRIFEYNDGWYVISFKDSKCYHIFHNDKVVAIAPSLGHALSIIGDKSEKHIWL